MYSTYVIYMPPFEWPFNEKHLVTMVTATLRAVSETPASSHRTRTVFHTKKSWACLVFYQRTTRTYFVYFNPLSCTHTIMLISKHGK